MIDSESTPGSPAPAVLRAAAILQIIANFGETPPRITDLAETLNLPKSSTTNILAALVETGLVRRTGNAYTLGSSLVNLASAFLRNEDPVQRFQEFVPTLPTVSGETVQLAMLNGADVVYLARHDGSQPITITSVIGKRLPASSTALGKSILANLDDETVSELIKEPLRQLTPKSHATLASLRNDLKASHKRGYAIDDEEAGANVICFAVAVPGRIGDGSYAVSTTLFKDRVTPEFQRDLVRDLTKLASYLATT